MNRRDVLSKLPAAVLAALLPDRFSRSVAAQERLLTLEEQIVAVTASDAWETNRWIDGHVFVDDAFGSTELTGLVGFNIRPASNPMRYSLPDGMYTIRFGGGS